MFYFVAIIFLLVYNKYIKKERGFNMIPLDCRIAALRKLDGKWGKAACITLAYMSIFFIFSIVQYYSSELLSFILNVLSVIIEVPLSFGLINSYIKLYNDEEIRLSDLFNFGFKNFKKSWKITWQILLKLIIPFIIMLLSIVLIVIGVYKIYGISLLNSIDFISTIGYSFLIICGVILYIISLIWGIMKSYYYKLSYIVAIENPDIISKDAVLKSQELMKGNRSKLFWLHISFIGWAILALCTIGIGYLWLVPYEQLAMIAFYKFLTKNKVKNEENINVEEADNNNSAK